MDIKSTHSTDFIKHVMSMSAIKRMAMSSYGVVQRMYAEAIGENSRDVHSDTNEMSFTISHLFFLFYPDCMPTACPENFSIHFLPHPSAPIVIEIHRRK